jgi:hypothetical protein
VAANGYHLFICHSVVLMILCAAEYSTLSIVIKIRVAVTFAK